MGGGADSLSYEWGEKQTMNGGGAGWGGGGADSLIMCVD